MRLGTTDQACIYKLPYCWHALQTHQIPRSLFLVSSRTPSSITYAAATEISSVGVVGRIRDVVVQRVYRLHIVPNHLTRP